MDGSTLLPLQMLNVASSSDWSSWLPLQMLNIASSSDGSILLPLQMVNMSSSSGWSTLLPSFQSVAMFSCFCEEEEQILCTRA